MDAYQIVWGTTLILAAILAPGLSVSLALIPRIGDIDWAERLGLALIFGITPHVILHFLDKNASVPLTETSSLASIFGVTAAGLIIWNIRLRGKSAEKTGAAATKP